MKRHILVIILLIFSISLAAESKDIILKLDNGTAATAGYSTVWMMEETKLLVPAGPCRVEEIQIYFTGQQPNKDTIYIVGDPAEGSISPTFWCLSYNMKIPPIYFDYPGQPGWYKFHITGLHLDGLDRLVVQHRVQPNGPWFAFDTDGPTPSPYTSYLMDPFKTNSLGGPGQYYLANGDLLVRALVVYDLPDGDGSLPPPPPVMFDVTKSAGIVDEKGNLIKFNDVSVQDVNGDGWDDIVIKSNLYINQKDGTFKYDSSLKKFAPAYTSWADYDNDGNLDFYSLRNGSWDASLNMMMSRDRIIRNLGNMNFTEMPPNSIFNLPYPSPGKDFNMPNQYEQDSIFNPYSCITPLWTDYNGDGRVDLYLANNRKGFTMNGQSNERYFPDQLWKQQSNGTFVNVTKTSGVSDAEPFSKPNNSWYGYYDCYGANAVDYNNDGKQDIFVANYRLVKDNLYKNNGNGTMTDVAAQTGVQGEPTAASNYFGHGMGSEWADYNNDGNMDLCVGNLGHPDWRGAVSNPSLIYRNEGPPSYNFTNVREEMGLKFFEMNAGVLWADFDLDGYLDLWHGQISYVEESATAPMRPGLLYMNQGPPDYKLKDMTWFYGCALHGPWSAARIDYDHDGDLDIIICSRWDGVKLFRNDMPKNGDWLAVRLEGSPNEQVPLNAFGTKAIVYTDGKMFMRELNSIAGTRMTQNTNELHFGLGEVSKSEIDSLVLIYPNGKNHKLNNLAKNKRYFIPYMAQAAENGIASPQLVLPNNFSVNQVEPLQLKWSDVPSATKYEIEIYKDTELTDRVLSHSLSGNNYEHTGLADNYTYYWRVRANNNSDTSNWSSVWNFTIGNLIPNAPELISPADKVENISFNPELVWKEATYDAFYSPKTLYNVQLSDKEDFSSDIIEFSDLDSLNVTVKDTLKSNRIYYWRVQGNNKGALGDWSDTWYFKTMTGAAPPILTIPSNGDTNVQNKPRLTWEKVDGAENYHLQIAKDEEFTDMHYEANFLVLPTTKVFKNFDAGAKYYWRVRANKSGYPGEWSEVWWFIIENTTSVENYISNTANIQILPNSVSNYANITINCKRSFSGKVELFDALGKSLTVIDDKNFTEGVYFYSLNTDNYVPGIYFIKLVLNDAVITNRFVIVR